MAKTFTAVTKFGVAVIHTILETALAAVICGCSSVGRAPAWGLKEFKFQADALPRKQSC